MKTCLPLVDPPLLVNLIFAFLLLASVPTGSLPSRLALPLFLSSPHRSYPPHIVAPFLTLPAATNSCFPPPPSLFVSLTRAAPRAAGQLLADSPSPPDAPRTTPLLKRSGRSPCDPRLLHTTPLRNAPTSHSSSELAPSADDAREQVVQAGMNARRKFARRGDEKGRIRADFLTAGHFY